MSYAWLLDPIARTLEVLALEGDRWSILVTHAGDEVVHVPPFEAADLDLALLWDESVTGSAKPVPGTT